MSGPNTRQFQPAGTWKQRPAGASFSRERPLGLRYRRSEIHGQVVTWLQQEWVVEWSATTEEHPDGARWFIDKVEWRDVPIVDDDKGNG